MALPTGSSIGLAMECAHSFTAGIYWPRVEEDASRFAFGNAAHAISEVWIETGDDWTADAIVYHHLTDDDAARLVAVSEHVREWLASMASEGWLLFAEVPVAYDVARGRCRVLPRTSHRDYSTRKEGELVATIDLVAVKPGRLRACDWKTARWKPGMTWQLRFAAVALSSFLGAAEAEVELLYVDEDGVRAEGAPLDSLDLDADAAALRELWTRLHAGPQPPTPGLHCTEMYCKAVGHCAVTRAALAEVGASATIRIETPEDVFRVRDMLPMLEASVKAAKQRIEELALTGRAELPNGRRLVVQEISREVIECSPEVVAMLGRNGAASAVEHKVSKAGIERAVGRGAARDVVEALRAAGAVRESTYTKVVEKTARVVESAKER